MKLWSVFLASVTLLVGFTAGKFYPYPSSGAPETQFSAVSHESFSERRLRILVEQAEELHKVAVLYAQEADETKPDRGRLVVLRKDMSLLADLLEREAQFQIDQIDLKETEDGS